MRGETSSLSQEASETVKQRRQIREAPGPHFRRVAEIWSAILGYPVYPEQACLMMAGLKIAREAGQHQPDNLIDGIGYLELVQEVFDYGRNGICGPEPTLSTDFRRQGDTRDR